MRGLVRDVLWLGFMVKFEGILSRGRINSSVAKCLWRLNRESLLSVRRDGDMQLFCHIGIFLLVQFANLQFFTLSVMGVWVKEKALIISVFIDQD